MESRTDGRSFDPVWDEIYASGRQLNKYPYQTVVSFLFRNRRPEREPTRVLEIGFGAGNNLWFAAREGCLVSGVDASAAAVAFARARFAAEGLEGDLRQGDFTQLAFADEAFDLAIDRAALSQTTRTGARRAVAEVHRVLRPGGLFYSELYSDRATSRGQPGPDGTLIDIQGPYQGVGQMCFYSRSQVEELLAVGWRLRSLIHHENIEMAAKPYEVAANWCATAQKIGKTEALDAR